ncbi:hypothetical protein BD626DRAFT_525160 [Schizophyllum amplum]|uniref:Secreted protein n=1 Tax=Schizophyllum amplum TaxID=97359 RepID=A0A550BSM1_9AGAR|nr:hypothetical protein BD626DRAFT_525160 [Auriculariopsis ampla]
MITYCFCLSVVASTSVSASPRVIWHRKVTNMKSAYHRCSLRTANATLVLNLMPLGGGATYYHQPYCLCSDRARLVVSHIKARVCSP